jgi:hypothetical protein
LRLAGGGGEKAVGACYQGMWKMVVQGHAWGVEAVSSPRHFAYFVLFFVF